MRRTGARKAAGFDAVPRFRRKGGVFSRHPLGSAAYGGRFRSRVLFPRDEVPQARSQSLQTLGRPRSPSRHPQDRRLHDGEARRDPRGDHGPRAARRERHHAQAARAHRGACRRERRASPQGAVRRRGGRVRRYLPRGRARQDAAPERRGHRPEPPVRLAARQRLAGQVRVQPQRADAARDGHGAVPHQGDGGHAQRRPRHGHPHAKVTGKGQRYFVDKFVDDEGRLFPCA